ncbi:hypothetical protein LCX93_01405 [Sulfurimonas sp. SWIR-19]|uniref:hypothetical protein n=1 Tax=Sulfurimonas sp. SWIR-19 TaxID=2878390 RepID=UPI001CF5BA97|nr:hypothetical protein [Sulfurimonas sp. SWIR-19]UCN00600.1 hypothetical protein LCX93_01405 [Sulfurimonas sp. SWIR-19]
MSYKNVVLTGIPRSGSSLICSLYNNYANSLALLEPINPFSIKTQNSIEAVEYVNDFFFQMRKEIHYSKRFVTHHKENKIISNMLSDTQKESEGLRQKVVQHGYVSLEKELQRDFSLLIKQNAFFTALLPDLVNFFDTYVVVRNPLSVLFSWNSVDLPVYRGHVPAGERFDEALKKKLEITVDRIDRQVIILEWFFRQFLQNIPQSNVLFYEDIVAGKFKTLEKLSYDKNSINAHANMKNKNSNKLYNKELAEVLRKKIFQSSGYYKHFYSDEAIEEVFEMIDA